MLPQPECERLTCTVDWNFVTVEVGLVFGHGIVFYPLLIWKRTNAQKAKNAEVKTENRVMKAGLVSSLLVMLLYWLCLCNHVFVVSSLCLDDQRSLLLQFKKNLTFMDMADRSSSRLKWWNASDDCCKWMGVSCDKEGHVTSLDLSEESIYGGFENSTSLFSLQHLQHLNLAENYFVSEIPSAFNKLENLTYLNLSKASFVGQIPIEISQLTKLVTLDISSSFPFYTEQRLKLENPNLRRLVQNLTSIRQLYLDGVSISVPGHEWCSALLSLHDLQELRMSQCSLSGPLDPSLARLENLSVIVLDENNLSSPVPQTFAHFKNLTILRLYNCELTGTFPQKVFHIRTLSLVDISFNNNLHGFFSEFPLSGSLQTLRVSNTNFTGAFPHSIGNVRNLSNLDLSNCGFNGTIPDSLSNLTKLSYLDMSHNNFTGPMTSFGMAKNLTNLDLSDNDLSGIIPPSHFERLYNLVNIDLSYNSFTGSIPSSLFTLPSLQQIRLSDNEFSQLDEFINVTSSRIEILDISNNNLFGSIPSSLFKLPLLQVIRLSRNQFSQLDEFINVSSSILDTLDLSRNNLSGSFPTFIFHLSALSLLQLSSNKFNGSVQLNKLFELKNLTLLELSHLSVNADVTNVDPSSFPSISNINLASCNLKTFPGFLRNLSTLMYLDLSDNQIQGTVPNRIWKLDDLMHLNISHNLLTDLEGPLQNLPSNLVYLDLHYNKLQGSLPVFAKDVMYLDFSSNKFSSVIPRDIGHYLSLTCFLSLSNNTLHGSIPDSLCNASNLEVLDLSINKISGKIPSCLMMMSDTLEVINLKNNNISGPIPDTVQASCGLWTLNLHGNLLDGLIPKSLAHCLKLEEISTLRILVLRNNKFQGSLLCSKANKTWEMLQIVDVAFNNFSGKLPGKYFMTGKRDIHNKDEAEAKLIEKKFDIYQQIYYQDRVTVISKGLQMELVKILTIFTCIDFSSNHLEGPIPEELMDFNELYVLNLSNNALFGKIPSSIGNLIQLESLDLSQNSLSGEIPLQLASLSFLSYLNLSFNHLVGKIPTGTQLQSFPASSFEGNDGLYGPPLTENPHGKELAVLAQPECGRLACTIDWNFISVELGLVFGYGIVFGPLLIWKRWRVWYWQLIHKILCWIFPQMYLEYVTHRGQTYTILRWWY
ncbi:Receptor-like protein 12, partial [Mucuna pruriens]